MQPTGKTGQIASERFIIKYPQRFEEINALKGDENNANELEIIWECNQKMAVKVHHK